MSTIGMFRHVDSAMNKPCVLRSSGTRPMPAGSTCSGAAVRHDRALDAHRPEAPGRRRRWPGQFGPAGSAEPGDPEHLTGPDGEGDVVEHAVAGEIADLENGLADVLVDRPADRGELAPDHLRHEVVVIGVGDAARGR